MLKISFESDDSPNFGKYFKSERSVFCFHFGKKKRLHFSGNCILQYGILISEQACGKCSRCLFIYLFLFLLLFLFWTSVQVNTASMPWNHLDNTSVPCVNISFVIIHTYNNIVRIFMMCINSVRSKIRLRGIIPSWTQN